MKLDNTVATATAKATSFQQYHQARFIFEDLSQQKIILTTEVDQAQQILSLLLLTVPDPNQNLQVQLVAELIKTANLKLITIVSQYILHCTYNFRHTR